MFDSSRRLVLWNSQYEELLGFPSGFLKPGLTNLELTTYMARRGDIGFGDPDHWAVQRVEYLWSSDENRTETMNFGDQTYEIEIRPTEDGGIVYTYTDVTEQHRLVEERIKQQNMLENISRLSRTGGWELDLETQGLEWSPETCRIQEVPEGYVPNLEDAINFYSEESRPIISAAVEQGLKDGTPWNLELTMITAKGRHIWVHAFGEPVIENGKAVRMVGTFRDITEQKALEQKLVQAQKMEAVGQLTGGIAHDFNNLLSIIMGNAELVKRLVQDNPKVQKQIASIIRAVNNSKELTGRLLAFSRQQTLSARPTNVNKLILEMEDMLARTLEETIELKLSPGLDLLPAMIDPHQMENALINLSINARDAMPDGGALSISTRNQHLGEAEAEEMEDISPGEYVVISVSDSGVGISERELSRVFEPFYTTKSVGEGSGLGLSMVFGFAKQSKGHVEVESQVGQGTTVKIYLPGTNEPAVSN